ncbi:hypothetical protein C8Q80DRAFT_154846 [Daedaleopsis nitida]|nr:hypothetical protein C8Q80DRAFT_154846 [Daedaleopsis nitida]
MTSSVSAHRSHSEDLSQAVCLRHDGLSIGWVKRLWGFERVIPANIVVMEPLNGSRSLPVYSTSPPHAWSSSGSPQSLQLTKCTPRSLGTHTTTLCDVRHRVVGTYERVMYRDTVTLHGVLPLGRFDDWAPKRHIVSRSRIMTAPNGKQYEWRRVRRGLTLTDAATGQEIAVSQRGDRLRGDRITVQQKGLAGAAGRERERGAGIC